MVAAQRQLRGAEGFPIARFVDHPSFHEKDAALLYRNRAESSKKSATVAGHLSDDDTRDLAKRMHYAAFRLNGARKSAEATAWRGRYLHFRDQIILGNRKLIYRAVNTRVRDPQLAEDCAADCHLVMIRAVTSYNPWIGIRFSTYVFTCLLRELTRLVQKQTKDRLRQAASFSDFMLDSGLETHTYDVPAEDEAINVGRFLASSHDLLTDREKEVLCQRFGFNAEGAIATLKDIGSELQISKERVRQLQNSGLDKLRGVLNADGLGV